MKTKKMIALVVTIVCIISALLICGTITSGAYTIDVVEVPSAVTSGYVTYSDIDWNEGSTEAVVSIKNGTASVDNMSKCGYYTIVLCSDEAEVGTSTFFLSENGKLYSYDYVYDETTDSYSPEYSKIDTAPYVPNDFCKLLNIGGNYSVSIEDIPVDVTSAYVYVERNDNLYGEATYDVKASSDGIVVIDDLGVDGTYSIEFYGDSDWALGGAYFTLDKNGKIYTEDYEFNSTSGEWENVFVESDSVYFESFSDSGNIGDANEEELRYSATITETSRAVSKVEVQGMDDYLNKLDIAPNVIINTNMITISELGSGYYSVNFYDLSNDIIGYSNFYIDENGDMYSYEFNGNEPVLNPISSAVYNSLVEEENDYEFGNISVSIYGVTEDIDSVESYYLYGNSTDESLLFEPEYSSLSVEPFIVSGLGQEGNYKLSFFRNGEVVGNAAFYIGEDAKVYESDYTYDSESGTWQSTLVEADEIYYYDNTDIQDTDNYNYGTVKLTITNIPSNAYSIESYYYEEDDTFTYGTPFFPDTSFSNGTATINNLGGQGFYQFNFIKSDGVTKVGYVCVYIDENSEIYLYETSVNTDIMQLESTLTKGSFVRLKQYNSSTVEYANGSEKVTISSVPVTANNILVSVVTEDGNYSTYELKISVSKDGTFVLDNLGMNGDYVVTFMTGKDYIGTASFYLKDGKTYTATYSGDYELKLSALNKVVFVSNSEITNFEVGDVDLNGEITIVDSVLLQKYLINIIGYNASEYNISDVNEDGKVNVLDLVLLKQKLLKK